MNISATILAAGSSSRMGRDNKLLLPVHCQPIINHVCNAVMKSKIKNVVVVTGYQHSQIEEILPETIDGHDSIELGVDCLWSRDESQYQRHWAGFQIIDASQVSIKIIESLIRDYGLA